jgi:hypothetical protein
MGIKKWKKYSNIKIDLSINMTDVKEKIIF